MDLEGGKGTEMEYNFILFKILNKKFKSSDYLLCGFQILY